MDTKNLTFVISNTGDAAAVYDGEERIDTGHVSDVQERLIERLMTVEYTDHLIADPNARGWSGVAKTLTEAMG